MMFYWTQILKLGLMLGPFFWCVTSQATFHAQVCPGVRVHVGSDVPTFLLIFLFVCFTHIQMRKCSAASMRVRDEREERDPHQHMKDVLKV